MKRIVECFNLLEKLLSAIEKRKGLNSGAYIILMLWFSIVFGNLAISPTQAKPSDDHVKVGKQLLSTGNFPAAAKSFSQAIQLDPSNAEALALRGFILYWMNKPQLAIQDLDKSVQIDPKNYSGWTSRAEVLRHLQRYDESRKDLDKAIALKPNLPDAYYLRGLSSLLQGLHVRAQQDFTSAIKLGQSHKYVNFAYYWRGRTEEMQENYRAAIDDFTKSMSLGEPQSRTIRHLDPKAIYMYSAGESKAGSLGLLERGLCYSAVGEHEKAIADLTEVLKTSPKETLLYEKRGNALLALGKYQDALKDFNRALLLGTESGDVYFHLGLAHFCLKKYPNTTRDFSAWFERTFWEDDKKNPLALTMTILSMKRSQQESQVQKLLKDATSGMAKTVGWRKSVLSMLQHKIGAEQFVAQTEKKSLKDRTQAHCYASLYLLSESKAKEAKQHFEWMKSKGDRNLLEFTILNAEFQP